MPYPGYEGALSGLITEMLVKYYPSVENLARAHQWLLTQLESPGAAIPIRHTSNIIYDPTFTPRPKVNFFNYPDLQVGVIASDNEANTSLFAIVRSGWSDLLDKTTLHDLMRDGRIKIGILKNGVTTPESRRQLTLLGIRGGMNNHPARVALHKLKLYHLTDAAERADFPRAGFPSLHHEIMTRSYRLLSPLNVFPFPNEPRNFSLHITNPPERLDRQEFGESNQGKRALAGAILEYLSSHGKSDLFDIWLTKSCCQYTKRDAETSWKLWKDVRICMTPRNNDQNGLVNANVPNIKLPQPVAPNAPTQLIPVGVNTGENDNVPFFDVIENGKGRYHLSKFGIATGGNDRKRPFRIRIIDRNGQVIRVSEVTTAADLGIANAGRGDYDKNLYRIIDFPNSAVANHVVWKRNTE
jgi:hypothetical protein